MLTSKEDEDNEVFFGPVSKREKVVKKKLGGNRKTTLLLFNGNDNNDLLPSPSLCSPFRAFVNQATDDDKAQLAPNKLRFEEEEVFFGPVTSKEKKKIDEMKQLDYNSEANVSVVVVEEDPIVTFSVDNSHTLHHSDGSDTEEEEEEVVQVGMDEVQLFESHNKIEYVQQEDTRSLLSLATSEENNLQVSLKKAKAQPHTAPSPRTQKSNTSHMLKQFLLQHAALIQSKQESKQEKLLLKLEEAEYDNRRKLSIEASSLEASDRVELDQTIDVSDSSAILSQLGKEKEQEAQMVEKEKLMRQEISQARAQLLQQQLCKMKKRVDLEQTKHALASVVDSFKMKAKQNEAKFRKEEKELVLSKLLESMKEKILQETNKRMQAAIVLQSYFRLLFAKKQFALLLNSKKRQLLSSHKLFSCNNKLRKCDIVNRIKSNIYTMNSFPSQPYLLESQVLTEHQVQLLEKLGATPSASNQQRNERTDVINDFISAHYNNLNKYRKEIQVTPSSDENDNAISNKLTQIELKLDTIRQRKQELLRSYTSKSNQLQDMVSVNSNKRKIRWADNFGNKSLVIDGNERVVDYKAVLRVTAPDNGLLKQKKKRDSLLLMNLCSSILPC